jgi:hypothetical protein
VFESSEERQMGVLLRISQTIDVVGDVSVSVANPSELIAWANTLNDPMIFAWRGSISGNRFVHVTAVHARTPVHGRVTAVLAADDHLTFWKALVAGDLEPGDERSLVLRDLVAAWDATPIDLPD